MLAETFNFDRLPNLSINVSVKTLAVSNRNLKRPFVGNDDKHFAQTVLKDGAPPAHFQMALDFRPKAGVDIACIFNSFTRTDIRSESVLIGWQGREDAGSQLYTAISAG